MLACSLDADGGGVLLSIQAQFPQGKQESRVQLCHRASDGHFTITPADVE